MLISMLILIGPIFGVKWTMIDAPECWLRKLFGISTGDHDIR